MAARKHKTKNSEAPSKTNSTKELPINLLANSRMTCLETKPNGYQKTATDTEYPNLGSYSQAAKCQYEKKAHKANDIKGNR